MWMIILISLLCVELKLATAAYPCEVRCAGRPSSEYDLDYYWREYTDVVPLDAFPGGLDENNAPTYIGQVYTKEYELLPGSIYPGCNKILTSAYLEDFEFEENIKILCTNKPEKLKWRLTAAGEHHVITDCSLVNGGSEVGYQVAIGRVNFNQETIIGKAFPDDAPNAGLWIPGNSAEYTEYEILTYCPV